MRKKSTHVYREELLSMKSVFTSNQFASFMHCIPKMTFGIQKRNTGFTNNCTECMKPGYSIREKRTCDTNEKRNNNNASMCQQPKITAKDIE